MQVTGELVVLLLLQCLHGKNVQDCWLDVLWQATTITVPKALATAFVVLKYRAI
jgi:hypothetical protein